MLFFYAKKVQKFLPNDQNFFSNNTLEKFFKLPISLIKKYQVNEKF